MTKPCQDCGSPMKHAEHDELGGPVHRHVPTGKVRSCAKSGCGESWPVVCHNGRKRFCQSCARSRHRDQDREYRRAKRRDELLDADEFVFNFGITLEQAREVQREMGLGVDEMREWLRCLAE